MPVLWYVYKEIDSLIQQRQFFSRGGRSAPCAPVATLEQTLSTCSASGSYEFLRRTDPEIGSLRFLARGTKRQPEVLNTGGSFTERRGQPLSAR